MARSREPGDDPANDNYKNLGDPLQETLNQLQILEHIANSPRGLSPEDLALKERLEKHERELRSGKTADTKDLGENDNKDIKAHLAARWFTAELALQAHARFSGDLHLFDHPQAVLTELLKDVMHYCQVRSEGAPVDSPEYLDFDKLVKHARQELTAEIRQDAQISRAASMKDERPPEQPHMDEQRAEFFVFGAMHPQLVKDHQGRDQHQAKGPGEDPVTETELIKLHRELQYIANKDGAFTDAEKKRYDTINKILEAEPDLRKTLLHLEARQRKEMEDLVIKQRREPSQAFGQQYIDMEKRHDNERDRYISDYQKAQTIRDEMREQEKRKTLDRGLDPDEPKLTR